MSAPIPKTTDAWVVKEQSSEKGFDQLLELKKDIPIPPLGDNEVLVHIQAASLNYRDLIIPKVSTSSPANTRRTGH